MVRSPIKKGTKGPQGVSKPEITGGPGTPRRSFFGRIKGARLFLAKETWPPKEGAAFPRISYQRNPSLAKALLRSPLDPSKGDSPPPLLAHLLELPSLTSSRIEEHMDAYQKQPVPTAY